jgi:hypothetical protein
VVSLDYGSVIPVLTSSIITCLKKLPFDKVAGAGFSKIPEKKIHEIPK